MLAIIVHALLRPQSMAEALHALCDVPIQCSACIGELERGDPRRFANYYRTHVTSAELQPMLDAMAASPLHAVETLRATAAKEGIDQCPLVDTLAEIERREAQAEDAAFATW